MFSPFNVRAFTGTPAQIRGCDVFRLLSSIPSEHLDQLIEFLHDERPDLDYVVLTEMSEMDHIEDFDRYQRTTCFV